MKFQRTPQTRLLELIEFEKDEIELAKASMANNPWLRTLREKLDGPLLYRSFSAAEVGALRAYGLTIEEVK